MNNHIYFGMIIWDISNDWGLTYPDLIWDDNFISSNHWIFQLDGLRINPGLVFPLVFTWGKVTSNLMISGGDKLGI